MSAVWYGPNFPFYRGNTLLGSTSKVLPRQEDSRLIKNDFIQGIMTCKGERAFRPDFGGDVANYLFEQNDDESRARLASVIRAQAATYHPRIVVNAIDIRESESNPNMMQVTILGRTNLEASNVNDMLVRFSVPVAGTISASPVNPLESNNG